VSSCRSSDCRSERCRGYPQCPAAVRGKTACSCGLEAAPPVLSIRLHQNLLRFVLAQSQMVAGTLISTGSPAEQSGPAQPGCRPAAHFHQRGRLSGAVDLSDRSLRAKATAVRAKGGGIAASMAKPAPVRLGSARLGLPRPGLRRQLSGDRQARVQTWQMKLGWRVSSLILCSSQSPVPAADRDLGAADRRLMHRRAGLNAAQRTHLGPGTAALENLELRRRLVFTGAKLWQLRLSARSIFA